MLTLINFLQSVKIDRSLINYITKSDVKMGISLIDFFCLVIQEEKYEFFNILLPHVNINAVDSMYNSTPIMFASQKGNIQMVQKLLERGAEILHNDYKSALYFCFSGVDFYSPISMSHLKCAEILIRHGSDITHLKDHKYRIAKEIKNKLGENLIEFNDSNICTDNKSIITAPAENGIITIVDFLQSNKIDSDLLKKFVEFNLKFGSSIIDFLCLIISKDDIGLFYTLMKCDININEYNSTKTRTPIMTAAENGRRSLIKKLLKKGADISVQKQNDTYVSALSLCFDNPMSTNRFQCIECLVRAGSDIDHLRMISYANLYIANLIQTNQQLAKSKIHIIRMFDLCTSYQAVCKKSNLVKLTVDTVDIELVGFDTIQKISTKNLIIEIPILNDRTQWHLLPEGINFIGGICLDKPTICKIVSILTVEIDGQVRTIGPEIMYY